MSVSVPENTQLRAVRQLLSIVVDSFEKLEIVIHLHRVRFAAQTTVAIAQSLSLSGEAAAEALAELAKAGVVLTKENEGPGWWFDPNSSWASSVDALATIYQADRIEVVKLMSRMAMERARSSVAQRFADAFVLRPTKTKGKPDA